MKVVINCEKRRYPEVPGGGLYFHARISFMLPKYTKNQFVTKLIKKKKISNFK